MQSLMTLSGRSTSQQGESGQVWHNEASEKNNSFKYRDSDQQSGSPFWGARLFAVIVGALFVAGLYFGGVGARLGLYVENSAENWFQKAGITLQEVRIKGQVSLDDEQILNALGIRSGQSLLGFDAQAAQQRLAALRQVKSVRVMRLIPSTVLVEITERRPFARWLHDGQVDFVDKEGVILSRSSTVEKSSFPLISGEGAAPQAARLIRLLSIHQELAKRINMAERVGRYRWNLHARNGAVIMLPPAGLALSLARLISLPDWQDLLERPRLVIDLRSAQHVFVRVRKNTAPSLSSRS